MYRELKSYSWLAKVKQKTPPIVIMESVRRDELGLFRCGIPQDSHRRFSAGCAEFLMAMKSFIGVTLAFAQSFYLLHLAVVFFSDGKEFKQPDFKQLVRLGRSGKELPSPRA
jgi:hypothetical protein